MKRREAKSRGQNERYTHLNAEFQRIARRDKKAFLRDQCKDIEENKRMGKTGDLFKKFRDTKGTFHAKMGSIKDRNGMNIKKEIQVVRQPASNSESDKEKGIQKKILAAQKISTSICNMLRITVFLPPLLNIFCFC